MGFGRATSNLGAAFARLAFGADVFISYARVDGAAFAEALANDLVTERLSCHLDLWEAEPGRALPRDLLLGLWRASMMVVVATDGAAVSRNVAREVRIFRRASRIPRPILVVDVAGAVHTARWARLVEGIHPISEPTENVAAAKPSRDLVRRVLTTATFRRRNQRLRRIGLMLLAVVVALGGAALLLAQNVTREAAALASARGDLRRAGDDLKNTEAELDRQRAAVATAVADKAAAEANATKARGNARSMETAAAARHLVDVSPERALAMAIEAVEMAPTTDARAAVVAAMNEFVPHRCLPRHAREIQTGAFSPDGTMVATAGYDGRVRVTATKDLRPRGAQSFEGPVGEIQWSPSAPQILVAPYAEPPVLWTLAPVSATLVLREAGSSIEVVEGTSFSRDGQSVALLSHPSEHPDESLLRVWGLDGRMVARWSIGRGAPADGGASPRDSDSDRGSVAFLSEKRLLAVARDGELGSLELGKQEPLARAQLPAPPTGPITLTKDRGTFVVGLHAGGIAYRESWSLAEIAEVPKPCRSGWKSPLSRGSLGSRMAVSSSPGGVTICEVFGGVEAVQTLAGTDDAIYGTAIADGGEAVVLWGWGNVVRLFELPSGQLARRLLGHTAAIRGARFDPSGHTVLTWSSDGSARLWQPFASPAPDQARSLDQRLQHPLALNRDGREAVFMADDRTLWRTGHTSGPVPLAAGRRFSFGSEVRFDATGVWLTAVPEVGAPLLWDVAHAWRSLDLGFLKDCCLSASIDAGGSILAVVTRKFALEIWDLRARVRLPTTAARGVLIQQVTISPDGQTVAATSEPDFDHHSTVVWDRLREGKDARLFQVDQRSETISTQAVIFDPTGRRLATGADDGFSFATWQLDVGPDRRVARRLALIREPLRGSLPPLHPAWSNDGRLLATVRGKTHIWDAETGQLTKEIDVFGGSVAFAQDAIHVVVAAPHAIQVLTCDTCAPTEQLLKTARKLLSSRTGCAPPAP